MGGRGPDEPEHPSQNSHCTEMGGCPGKGLLDAEDAEWWHAACGSLTMTLAVRGRSSPSAASSMVVWPYRSEMSSSDQLKGTSGSGRKEERVFSAFSVANSS